MDQKTMISNFSDIKIRLWGLLLIGGALSSSCGNETENQNREENPIVQIEENIIENQKSKRAEEKEVQSNEKGSSDNDIAYQKGEFDKYGEQYSLTEIEDGEYEVTLYDKENKVVHTETFTKLPWISEMTDNILQIGLSLGSPAPYIYYYDKERAVVSPCYPDSFILRIITLLICGM